MREVNKMKKKKFIAQLENVSKLIEYIFDNDWIEYEVNQIEFSELLKNVSYYEIDEIIDYLENLIRLEDE
jgi:hypothetical protein